MITTKGKWLILPLVLALVFVILPGNTSAQGFRVTTIKAGYFNPKGAKAGFLVGVNFGTAFDENVDIGIGIDYFRRNYKRETVIAESVTSGGTVTATKVRELDFTTTIVPLMGTITIKLSVQYPLAYYVGGGLGYEFLFNNEKNFEDGLSESRRYSGFCWMINGGVLYRIGSRSALVGEAFYNHSTVSRGKSTTPRGLPVWEEVNLSGLGFRFGVRLGFF